MTDKPKATDLLGIDPDYTGEACSVDYIRWQRGADAADEYVHVACWKFLNARKGDTA